MSDAQENPDGQKPAGRQGRSVVPLGEVHPEVLAAVRALIDNYGALGVVNIITQLTDLDRYVAENYPDV